MVQSKIRRLGFKEIVDPTTWHCVYDWRATWKKHGGPIKIGQAKERYIVGPRHGIMVHLDHAIGTVQSIFSRLNGLQLLRIFLL